MSDSQQPPFFQKRPPAVLYKDRSLIAREDENHTGDVRPNLLQRLHFTSKPQAHK